MIGTFNTIISKTYPTNVTLAQDLVIATNLTYPIQVVPGYIVIPLDGTVYKNSTGY